MLARCLLPFLLLAVLAVPCLAQTENSSPSATPAVNAAGATSAANSSSSNPPKKVWTNDDLPEAKTAKSDARRPDAKATPKQPVNLTTVERMRKDLAKLQSQLDDVNKKLKSYEDFQKGEQVSTSERQWNKGLNREPVDQQIAQLRAKKQQLEGQISDLYDNARKQGIDSGQLR